MSLRRLRAPKLDGELLAEPPLDAGVSTLLANRARFSSWNYDFQGRSADRLQLLARREVFEKAREFHARFDLDVPEPFDEGEPLVVTGHQPELFHPGVWIKNFAAGRLAKLSGGRALNLIVDNDVPKNAAVRVPYWDGDLLKAASVEFDAWAGEIPYEDWTIRDEGRFSNFPNRVLERLAGAIADPLIEDFWPKAVDAASRTDRLGLRFSAARRAIEASWGLHNLEVPLSAVCETEAFAWFTAHLLAHLPRYQEIHNSALLDYRAAHGIRSRHHPVPALDREGDWIEAPFWVWRQSAPRRRPLMARQVSSNLLQIRIDGETDPLLELPLGPDREACCAIQMLQTLPALGVRLRTRALTTTMFSRYLLSDLFLHGIGGAKYDELGDSISRVFYGIEPPAYSTLSLTLWLGVKDSPTTQADLRRIESSIRSLLYNPDRHLVEPIADELITWIDAKRAAIAAPVLTRTDRRARFHAIRECNAALQPAVADQLAALHRRREQIQAGLRLNSLAHHREFAAVIHSQTRLREELGRIVEPSSRYARIS